MKKTSSLRCFCTLLLCVALPIGARAENPIKNELAQSPNQTLPTTRETGDRVSISTQIVVSAIRKFKPDLGGLKPQDLLVHDLGFRHHQEIVDLFVEIVDRASDSGLDVRAGDLAITPIPAEEFRKNYRITSADIKGMSIADLISRVYNNSYPVRP